MRALFSVRVSLRRETDSSVRTDGLSVLRSSVAGFDSALPHPPVRRLCSAPARQHTPDKVSYMSQLGSKLYWRHAGFVYPGGDGRSQ